MHEQSLIRALLRQVEAIRRQHGGNQVTEVRVEVGPLSGVEPLLLSSAFDELASASAAKGADFVIDEVPLLAECNSCRQHFAVKDFIFRCPECDAEVRVIQGDEFRLMSVSLSDVTRDPDLDFPADTCQAESQT